jgi:hypothetical protein
MERDRERNIDPAVFDKLGLVLLGIDSKGNVQQVYPSYASRSPPEKVLLNKR